ncbi:glycoside hydrolase family 99-like domain-containing protein [Paenibacillus baekrokdamisoli]|uniref:glycoside hydrolase family 99-like domain-containing protein n=1 Tax=Paenibacillus baekrokdamisoli TaxID=1712516 RepID=UPI000F778C88
MCLKGWLWARSKDKRTNLCWNEWTEGGYLEPDTLHGMAYLKAVRNVFQHYGE